MRSNTIENWGGGWIMKNQVYAIYRVSEASEIPLRVDNIKNWVCSIYICMDCTYAP